jgi:hypothetical protein
MEATLYKQGSFLWNPCQQLQFDPIPVPRTQRPITTVGITTADRPEYLERCLSSLNRQLNADAHAVRILVVDGSKNSRNESLARSVVANIRRESGRPITFVGQTERVAIHLALRALCDASLLEFAFRQDASGNRNIILLLSSGENVLLVDDDIVCDVWQPRATDEHGTTRATDEHGSTRTRDGHGRTRATDEHGSTRTRDEHGPARISLGGHIEERDIAFYSEREDVCQRLVPSRVDLLDAHHAVLGRSVKSLAISKPGVNQRRACGHLREAAHGARPAVVRMTLSGIAGDTGASYPDRLLFSSGSWKTVLAGSRQSFETAFTSREVCKVASRYVVMHEIACMTGCLGLANTSMTPPFLPVGRNEDGLFGATLSALDPRTVGCHIPFAVVHASPRSPRYADRPFPSARETRSADLLIELMRSWAPHLRTKNPRQRLIMVGECLQNLAGLRHADFVRVTSLATLRTRERELRLIESALTKKDTYPAYWQRALRVYRTTLLKHATKPSFLLPLEFHRARSISAGYDEFRQFVRTAGELFVEWPALWMNARTLMQSFSECRPPVDWRETR